MKYLLDTCIISKFLKEEPAVCKHIGMIDSSDIGLSIITKLEINYGFALHPNDFKKQRKRWENFCAVVIMIPFDDHEQTMAYQIKTDLHKRGNMIGAYDILIAATALAKGLVCVTNNIKEFNRVQGLKVEDWSRPVQGYQT